MGGCARSCTSSRTPSASATSTTAAGVPRCSSTAPATSSAAPSASTSAARRSPTSPAGAKTARWTRSANTPRRSTRSPAASKPPSTPPAQRRPSTSWPTPPDAVVRRCHAPHHRASRARNRWFERDDVAGARPGTGRMQPHTDRPTTSTASRRGDEADLYQRHHQALLIAVSHAINGSGALIEDACQSAWTILMRRQPERASVFAWLYVVALHEAYRLSAIERRELHLEDLAIEGDWETILAGRVTVEDQLEASKPCAPSRACPTANATTS